MPPHRSKLHDVGGGGSGETMRVMWRRVSGQPLWWGRLQRTTASKEAHEKMAPFLLGASGEAVTRCRRADLELEGFALAGGSNVPPSTTRTPATGDDPGYCKRGRNSVEGVKEIRHAWDGGGNGERGRGKRQGWVREGGCGKEGDG
uniref:DUF834 domain-containing protein n=1 Tax=Oryza barthii TaxID=65489 RepID=A0A0D3FKJ9_9ORYZ